MDRQNYNYRIIVICLLILQLAFAIFFIGRLVNDLGWLALGIPAVVLILLVGAWKRNRPIFIGVFVWSLFILIFSILNVIVNSAKILALVFIIFALVQFWCVSQTDLEE